MPSKMRRYGTAGRPGVPGGFSGPNSGAIRLHNSSGVCHIVSNGVAVAIPFLLSWDEQGKYMLPRPRFQFFGQTLIETGLKSVEVARSFTNSSWHSHHEELMSGHIHWGASSPECELVRALA